MNPALMFLVGLPAAGITLFTVAVCITDLRLLIARERRAIDRAFGHAHRVYPPAPPMKVRPSQRGTTITAPLSDCVWKESV